MNVVDVEDLGHGIDCILPLHKIALRLLLDLRLVSSHLLHLDLHIRLLLLTQLLCNFLMLLLSLRSHLLLLLWILVHSDNCFTRRSPILLLLLDVVHQNDFIGSPLIRNILGPDLIYGLQSIIIPLILDGLKFLPRDAHILSLRLVGIFVQFCLLRFPLDVGGLDHVIVAIRALDTVIRWM